MKNEPIFNMSAIPAFVAHTVFMWFLLVLAMWSVAWAIVLMIVNWQVLFWFMVFYGTYRFVVRRKN